MVNVFTRKNITVECKFITSRLTPNQVAAAANVTTPGGLIVDRTTSQQLANMTQVAVFGTGAGIVPQKNN